MKIVPLFFILWIAIAQAQMVDTYAFHSEAERVRAVALAKSLRCLQCQNQNLVESNAPEAYTLRLEVYEMVNQGKSDREIVQIMTARFGDFVHYNPPFKTQTWLLWGLPFGGLVLLFAATFWRSLCKRKESDDEITT